jgi:hypothetical protein|tara:strand:+ start:144 stop:401 length:258 start_codon:yes stop_codon:yes gene_type:complete
METLYKKLNRLENLLDTYYDKHGSIYKTLMDNYNKEDYILGSKEDCILQEKFEQYNDIIKLAQVEIYDLEKEIKILEKAYEEVRI